MMQLSDALVIIDLQKGVCSATNPIYNLESLIQRLNSRISDYFNEQKTIVFIQHTDSDLPLHSEAFSLLDNLRQPLTSRYVQKTHANSFYHTNLAVILEETHCQSIEIWGAQTEYCIDATTKFAHGLGYTVQMVSGSTTTYDTSYMTAQQTISFYEAIWTNRFVTMLS